MNIIYPALESGPDTRSADNMALPDPAEIGAQWPRVAHTMLSIERLNNIQGCLGDCIERDVPGDFIEAGVWRGGACIFAKAILEAYAITDRAIWVADSFRGVPPPNPHEYPADRGSPLHLFPQLAVSRSEVERNFVNYGLLDERVHFLEGWFADTLASAPINRIAVLRLDGDLYESTMDALQALYHKLSPGGYAIIDDYGVIEGCRQAVTDFRESNDITEDIVKVDPCAVYWQRSQA